MPPTDGDIVRIPPDEESAVYANAYEVWASDHDIALDLHVVGPFDESEGARAASPVVRVRLPATMVFPMVQRLSAVLGDFLGEDWS